MTLSQLEYRNIYLNSPGWKLTRWLRKSKYCQKCGSTDTLHLHHEEYHWHNRRPLIRYFLPNMGDNMKTLCSRCHRLAHQRKG